MVNFLLGIVTLTIYRFWAKTEVRKHIWSCVHINGQPLEYTGRGGELFKGALIVFAVFGLPVVRSHLLALAYGPEHPALVGMQGMLFLVAAAVLGGGDLSLRRYQLSRTLWRGIRGSLEGSATTYSLLYFGKMLARGMTLGWATPVLNLSLQEHIVGTMKFGDLPFKFKGRAGPLYPSYALLVRYDARVHFRSPLLGSGIVGGVFGERPDGHLRRHFQRTIANRHREQGWNLAMLILGIFAIYLVFYAIYPAIWALYSAREMAIFASYTTAGRPVCHGCEGLGHDQTDVRQPFITVLDPWHRLALCAAAQCAFHVRPGEGFGVGRC